MQSNGEKLREALQVARDHIDMDALEISHCKEAELIREALALPTADHIPDAGKMIETAAPVGEREAFEKWAREQFYSGLACPSDTWSDERKTYSDVAHHMAFCAFRAAMRKGQL